MPSTGRSARSEASHEARLPRRPRRKTRPFNVGHSLREAGGVTPGLAGRHSEATKSRSEMHSFEEVARLASDATRGASRLLWQHHRGRLRAFEFRGYRCAELLELLGVLAITG